MDALGLRSRLNRLVCSHRGRNHEVLYLVILITTIKLGVVYGN